MKKILSIALFLLPIILFGQVITPQRTNAMQRSQDVIGDMFEKTTMADTVGVTAYTDGHTTYSFNANRLRVQTTSGGSSLYDGRVFIDTFNTGLDVITAEIKVQYNTTGGTNYGVPFGMYNPNVSRYSCLGLLWTAAGSPIGTVSLYSFVGPTPTLLSTAESVLSFSVGDIIVQKFDAFENVVTFSVRNETTNSAWISTSYTFKNTEVKYSSGNIAVGSNSNGDWYLNSVKISSRQMKNPKVYLLGDSKFSKSTNQPESYTALLKNNLGEIVANSDPAGASSDAITQLFEIYTFIKPEKVLYSNSNDERYGISNATWQAQYDTIYNRLARYGIPVYFTSFYETNTSQADVNTFLAANYPSVYIQRPYTALTACGSACLLADGIHLNGIGNQVAFEETLLDAKLNGNLWDMYKDVVSATIPTPQSGYGVLYNRADTLRFKNDNGVELSMGGGAGGGSVTSVGSGFGLTGGPITTSGTLVVDTTSGGVTSWRRTAKVVDSLAALIGTTTWNGITSPTGDQALTFQAGESSTWTDQNTTEDLFTVNNATQTTGSVFSLNRTSTAITTGNNIMELNSSGANSTGSTEAYGLVVSVTNTGTGAINRAAKFTASGAATNNIAIEAVGRVGVNEPLPQTMLQVGHGSTTSGFGTAAQLLISNSGSASYLSVLGPSGSEAYIGAESGQGVFGMLTNHPLLFRTNNTLRGQFTAAGTLLMSYGVVEKQGADVASVAGAISLGVDGNSFEITGTNAITLISNVNFQNGHIVTLLFTSTATLTDGTANSGTDIGMELAGNTNFVGSAGATLTLILSEIGGTQRWREVARSVQ